MRRYAFFLIIAIFSTAMLGYAEGRRRAFEDLRLEKCVMSKATQDVWCIDNIPE